MEKEKFAFVRIDFTKLACCKFANIKGQEVRSFPINWAFSNGDLYTVLTNKKAKGKKGALIPLKQRNKVKEVTLDMAGNMGLITKQSFPNAVQIIDRFHVQKLALDALQEIRIKYRWDAVDKENDAIEDARAKGLIPDLVARKGPLGPPLGSGHP